MLRARADCGGGLDGEEEGVAEALDAVDALVGHEEVEEAEEGVLRAPLNFKNTAVIQLRKFRAVQGVLRAALRLGHEGNVGPVARRTTTSGTQQRHSYTLQCLRWRTALAEASIANIGAHRAEAGW